MILLLIVLFLALSVAGGLVVLSAVRRAPEGWEDGAGFHLIAATAEAESRPDLAAGPAPEDCGLGRVEEEIHAGPRRAHDLELPFGVV